MSASIPSEVMLTKEQVEKFRTNGYIVLENELDPKTVKALCGAAQTLLDDFDMTNHPRTKFTTGDKQVSGDYFLDSAWTVSYFFEEGAFDKNGELTVDKRQAINKIGHALHIENEVCKDFTMSDRMRGIAKSLSFVKPEVLQSMYIFKQPHIGGEVSPHQDSTFLYTDPPSACGVWVALEDCTLTNGCLYFAPGSHKTSPVAKRFARKSPTSSELSFVPFTSDAQAPEMNEYVPVPCKAGSVVLIDGAVYHHSCANISDKSRWAYTFHIIDGDAKWDGLNWLAQGPGFKRLY